MIRIGKVCPKDVPGDLNTATGSTEQPPGQSSDINVNPPPPPLKSVFQDGMGPNDIGQAYRPYNERGQKDYTYLDRIAEQKRVEEAEDVDVNAGIHGNWTIENAKSKLHQFLQTIKVNTDYKYTPVGPDHTRYEKNKKTPHEFISNSFFFLFSILFFFVIKSMYVLSRPLCSTQKQKKKKIEKLKFFFV